MLLRRRAFCRVRELHTESFGDIKLASKRKVKEINPCGPLVSAFSNGLHVDTMRSGFSIASEWYYAPPKCSIRTCMSINITCLSESWGSIYFGVLIFTEEWWEFRTVLDAIFTEELRDAFSIVHRTIRTPWHTVKTCCRRRPDADEDGDACSEVFGDTVAVLRNTESVCLVGNYEE